MKNIAMLIAGGAGNRMHQDIPKQFLTVNEKPVIVYTLEVFEKHPEIDAIAVVCIQGWEQVLWAYAKQSYYKSNISVKGNAGRTANFQNHPDFPREICRRRRFLRAPEHTRELWHKADVLIIDYIGLLSEPDMKGVPNQFEVITEIMRRIKALCRTLNVAVLLLAQTNREAENRANKVPIMSDLKGSGQIEQDSANIIMLSAAEETDPTQPECKIKADIIKARNGTLGQVVLCADFARASVWEQPIGGVV